MTKRPSTAFFVLIWFHDIIIAPFEEILGIIVIIITILVCLREFIDWSVDSLDQFDCLNNN